MESIWKVVESSEELQDQLWSYAIDIGKKNPDSKIVGLFIESLNEVIDIHTKRVEKGLFHSIPGAVWAALYCLAVLSFVLLGYEYKISGGGNIITSVILACAFSIVIMLITDMERSMEGRIRVSQEPYIHLQDKLQSTVPDY